MAGQGYGTDVETSAPKAISAGGPGVVNVALTTTPALFIIPNAWRGQLCRFILVGGSGRILFGTSAVAVVAATASGVSSNVITPNEATGDYLGDGVAVHMNVPADAVITHFSAVSSANANLYIRPLGIG